MELNYINSRGQSLSLSNNQYFHLMNVDGQTYAATNISSLIIGDIDGDIVNNVQAQPRQIIIDLRIKSGVNVEEAKRAIFGIVKIKQSGTLVWTQNNRTVQISGIIESVDMPRYTNDVAMQITLHCEQPFWEDIESIVQQVNEYINLHYFTDEQGGMLYFTENGRPLGLLDTTRTKDFHNNGDVDIGVEIEIIAYDTVTNPIIYDTFGNYFGVGYGTGDKKVTMKAGDIIYINTNKGKKYVSMNSVNLLGKIKPNSTWIQLVAGDNQFSIDSDDENKTNMMFNISYKQRYI